MRSARFVAFLILALAPALAEEPFYLKDGDRVVFYGDSITDQRLCPTFVETYVDHFPSMNMSRLCIQDGVAIA